MLTLGSSVNSDGHTNHNTEIDSDRIRASSASKTVVYLHEAGVA